MTKREEKKLDASIKRYNENWKRDHDAMIATILTLRPNYNRTKLEAIKSNMELCDIRQAIHAADSIDARFA